MSEACLFQLEQNLRALNLTNAVKHLGERLRQARESGMDYGEFLLDLTDLELGIRTENREKRRLKEGRFPLLKLLETFDFDAAPGLDRRLVRDLAQGDYIGQKRNVILLGKSGTGKTHLATALGIEACRQNRRVRFVTGYGLANELIEARAEKNLGRLIGQALERATICSSDPLCSEHNPSVDRSLHVASCHACTFVAETSCERGNRYLDRALLVNTFECRDASFFQGGGGGNE